MIAGRADPPWPLARRRARGELVEVRAADLRFTREEAAAFLNDGMALGLSPQEVEVLSERTEGWIVGLQMAALSLRGHDDVSAYLQALSASDRYILDYLLEEVLERQPRRCTSSRWPPPSCGGSAPLCAAVTGREDAAAILAHPRRPTFLVAPDAPPLVPLLHLLPTSPATQPAPAPPSGCPSGTRAPAPGGGGGAAEEAIHHAPRGRPAAGRTPGARPRPGAPGPRRGAHGGDWFSRLPAEVVRGMGPALERAWLCGPREDCE